MPSVRRRLRRGYTMIEVLMALSVSAVLYLVIAPRVEETRSRASLRAARQGLESTVAATRAAALQKGKTATLTMSGNAATVTVLSGLAGAPVTVYGPVRFDRDLGTTLQPVAGAPASIAFDARGILTPIPAGVRKYRLSNGTFADTVCISPTGILLPRGCQL